MRLFRGFAADDDFDLDDDDVLGRRWGSGGCNHSFADLTASNQRPSNPSGAGCPLLGR
jgi:hypothetical protein